MTQVNINEHLTYSTPNHMWEQVIKFGYYIRQNSINGQKGWGYAKTLIESWKDTQNFKLSEKILELIKNVDYTFYDDVSKQESSFVTICDDVLFNGNEIHHFIVQHFRLPSMFANGLPLVKLLQIAFNIGQAKCEFERNTYTSNIATFYAIKSLNKLSTFIYE